jgi:DinB superfamily
MPRNVAQTRRSPPESNPIAQIVRIMLDASFTGKGWQGPTLTGSLRGLSARQALWSPTPDRRCVWEQVLHAAYWKWSVARILSGTGAEFPRSPANWPAVPAKADEPAWKRDRTLLGEAHERLIEAAIGIASTSPGRLHERPGPKYKWTIAFYLAGAAAHDAYHTGQVQLLKRLMPTRVRPARRVGKNQDA